MSLETHDVIQGPDKTNFENVSLKKLGKLAELFHSPRLMRAVRNWRAYAAEEMKGVKKL